MTINLLPRILVAMLLSLLVIGSSSLVMAMLDNIQYQADLKEILQKLGKNVYVENVVEIPSSDSGPGDAGAEIKVKLRNGIVMELRRITKASFRTLEHVRLARIDNYIPVVISFGHLGVYATETKDPVKSIGYGSLPLNLIQLKTALQIAFDDINDVFAGSKLLLNWVKALPRDQQVTANESDADYFEKIPQDTLFYLDGIRKKIIVREVEEVH